MPCKISVCWNFGRDIIIFIIIIIIIVVFAIIIIITIIIIIIIISSSSSSSSSSRSILMIFHSRISWWPSIGIFVAESLLRSPGLLSVFWPSWTIL